MTAIKDLLKNVKALFEAPIVVPPVEPAAPASVLTFKLKDGTDISIALKDPIAEAEPTVGDMVTIAGMPATEGILELEDGSTITVDAMGTITEITPVLPVTTEIEMATPPAPTTVPTVEERLSAIEEKLSKMVLAATPIPTAVDTASVARMAKQDEVIAGLFSLVEKMADVSSAAPVTLSGHKKDQFERANKKEEALKQIAAGINSLKNKK